MSKVISFINYKGGTGKTTSVINIGANLANQGKKVLLIDLDPQANLSEGLGVYDSNNTMYYYYKNKISATAQNVKENLDIIPSNLDLVGFDFDLPAEFLREKVVDNLVKDLLPNYEYVLIDLPPTLNTVVINALVISDYICIPMEAEFFAFRGLDRIMDIAKKIKSTFKPNLNLLGVFVTKFNPTRSLSKHILDAVNDNFDNKLLNTKIRINVKLSEAQTEGKDIYSYDPESNGAKDYEALTLEILELIND